MESIKDYDGRELIKTIDSERYGDHTDWKDNLNMGYVDKFDVLIGKDRERFIKRSIENTQWHWEDTIPKQLDELIKINSTIQHSIEYIDTQSIINEWLDVDDNRIQAVQLLNLIMKGKI